MHKHQDRPASSRQWLRRHDILNFITTLYEGDLHAKRVLSLANATQGVLTSASLAIHAVGRGLAQAMGTLTKHGVKQVDRLLSNRGVDVWAFFAYWTPFIVAARTEVVVALDWTSFAADGQDTIVLSMVTGHGRATPLLWKTVASSTLKGNQRRYEYELLCRLREVLPAGVKVTVVADRGFGDCKLFYALTTELAFEYVIRLRGDIYVTSAGGERRTAAAWVGAGGRARRLVGARVTDTYELPVGAVVCVQDPKMDEPWCLVASEAKGAHSRFPGAVCRQRWTVRLGEVEPVFGQTGRVVLDITARTAHDGALKWTRAPSTPRAARSPVFATFPSTCALPSGGRWSLRRVLQRPGRQKKRSSAKSSCGPSRTSSSAPSSPPCCNAR